MENTWLFSVETKEASKHPTKYQQRKHNYVQKPPKKKAKDRLVLLKGFSLKEISALRGTAEKTIRQQAPSIYQKTGVSGRHAFAAWFIEDFL